MLRRMEAPQYRQR